MRMLATKWYFCCTKDFLMCQNIYIFYNQWVKKTCTVPVSYTYFLLHSRTIYSWKNIFSGSLSWGFNSVFHCPRVNIRWLLFRQGHLWCIHPLFILDDVCLEELLYYFKDFINDVSNKKRNFFIYCGVAWTFDTVTGLLSSTCHPCVCVHGQFNRWCTRI